MEQAWNVQMFLNSKEWQLWCAGGTKQFRLAFKEVTAGGNSMRVDKDERWWQYRTKQGVSAANAVHGSHAGAHQHQTRGAHSLGWKKKMFQEDYTVVSKLHHCTH